MADATILILIILGVGARAYDCPKVYLKHGEVEQVQDVLEFKCKKGFVLKGISRLNCAQNVDQKKSYPRCIRPRFEPLNDQPVYNEGNGELKDFILT